jgi:tRNA uridine 5-carboxymethylaminomethyl modification enzyme
MLKKYDVIVIGAGHAGLESATAAARVGAKVALITISQNNIGEMSCNPAIGGLGKGHIVREIDALDGVMAKIIDESGIQFRVLNESRGPAVQGPRAQADRKLYKKNASKMLDFYKEKYNLDVIFASVEDIILDNKKVSGVVLNNGEKIDCTAIVLTTGTFVNGVIHIGKTNYPAGRYGDKPSIGLGKFLKDTGFEVGRLKTGTPARLDAKTINFSVLEEQKADAIIKPFSFLNKEVSVPQVSCYITYTNDKTHQIIKDNIGLSAMYSGNISGVGPRYCPSIEDKVVRFASKNQHQIFLEPEGLDDDTIYPNGISTSLPQEVQDKFIRSMVGLENVKIIRYGYAIEYDYVNPQELTQTLQTKKVENLFFAGQINGTTGYEEAAGQGLIAGVNAGLKALNSAKTLIINRNEGYIGVMIDDLIHQGVKEPYRMFSSRAEYRMHLRADNADIRLTQKGYDVGCVDSERYNIFKTKIDKLNAIKAEMESLTATPNKLLSYGLALNQDGIKRNALQWLSFTNISIDDLAKVWQQLSSYDREILDIINIDCKYAFYIKRQAEEINQFLKEEGVKIPNTINFADIKGLSAELVEKFTKIKPTTIGSAMRVAGATPSSAIAILAHINKLRKNINLENAS